MGSADRVSRLVLAAIIAVLYFTDTITGVLGIMLLIPGAIFVLIGFLGFCPLYLPFKIITCKNKSI